MSAVAKDARRYPLASLCEATGLTEAALGRLVGLSGSSLQRAREWGLVESAADRYACRAGVHPILVWSDFGLVECAAEDCAELFAQARAGHRFCSARCRSRVNGRELYRSSSSRREAQVAKAARYYEEAGEYKRRQAAARYEANREVRQAQMRAAYRRRVSRGLSPMQSTAGP